MLKKLKEQSAGERLQKSEFICEKLFALKEFREAVCVAFYVSMSEEVDTGFMIDKALSMGKKVVVPLCHEETVQLSLYAIRNRERLEKSAYGILQPVPDEKALVAPKNVDCILVPGVVFDKKNNRIGRGKGFYDRFLKRLNPEARKIGLAFGFQVLEEVPVNDYDVPMDKILTESS